MSKITQEQLDCLHDWEQSNFVVDTLPATYTAHCLKCDADSHDGGETLCEIKHYG